MRLPKILERSVLLASLAGLAACGSSKGGSALSTEAAPVVQCSTHVVADALSHGALAKQGLSGTYIFDLSATSPSPPGLQNNVWTVVLRDAGGAPVQGATFAKITPYMPDHGHGSAVIPTVTARGDGYEISNIYLFMPGLWQLTLTATGPDGKSDTAVFSFCVAG